MIIYSIRKRNKNQTKRSCKLIKNFSWCLHHIICLHNFSEYATYITKKRGLVEYGL